MSFLTTRANGCTHVSSSLRKRNEFTITDTELKLIATAAIIGDSKIPKMGNNTPAATGTPRAL
jgi:hypothetical protein